MSSRARYTGYSSVAAPPGNRLGKAATGRGAPQAIRAQAIRAIEMNDQKNTLLFIVLSALILIGWQIFFGLPQMERQRQQQPQQTQEPIVAGTPNPGSPTGIPQPPVQQPQPPAQPITRAAALAASPRIRIETPRLSGSIALKGGRIDDLALVQYRETVDPQSPPIVLLAPAGSPQPFYAEFGWLPAQGGQVKRPDENTLGRQEGGGALTLERPVTLAYDNGEGLAFRRTIAIDDKYLFTIKDEVANTGAAPVTMHPFALISR